MAKKPDRRAKPPTSKDLDSFRAELTYAGDGRDLAKRIEQLKALIEKLDLDERDRKLIEVGRGEKKNFAQRLSESIAQKTADALRTTLKGILPDEDGRGHETKSAGAAGMKKLDVNYSSTRSGLELAVSIKTINFKDGSTNRYTKNVKRVDGELRAEAEDCHKRQPFSVLVAYVFLPADSARDGTGASSCKHAANVLETRSGRQSRNDENSLFEEAFLGLYESDGAARFYRPKDFPTTGTPKQSLTFSETLELVKKAHLARNKG